MIEGVVNAAYEAVVALSLQGPAGRAQDIEAVVVAVEAEHGQGAAKQREAIGDADRRLEQNLAQCAVAVCYPDFTTRQSLPYADLMWTVRDGVRRRSFPPR